MRLFYLLFIYLVFCYIPSWSQESNFDYHVIKNISLRNQNVAANCFAQDSLGMIWVGTNNGLYNYDGYTAKGALLSDSKFNTFIHAILTIDSAYLAVGTGNGLFLYDYRNDSNIEILELSHSDVRCLLLDNDKLWIGTLYGLYIYEIKHKRLIPFHKNTLDSQTIYALQKIENRLFLGTYNGLFEIDAD
jgi:ligand-binding sensor domain-containing protein